MRQAKNVTLWEVTSKGMINRNDLWDPFFFPGGEPHFNLSPDAAEKIFDNFFLVDVRGGASEDFLLASLLGRTLGELNAGTASLFAPYFPGARQDRGYPDTLKMLRGIALDNFNSVFTVDLHNPQEQEDIPSRARIINLDPPALPDELFMGRFDFRGSTPSVSIISPDEGATERAKAVADLYGFPLVQARKVRDPENNFRVSSIECDPVETDMAIVVDDICDGGGTFIGLAEATGLFRERLRLWTTHGIYSKGTEKLYNHYSFIGSTDSFPHTRSIHVTSPVISAFTDYMKIGTDNAF